MVWRKIGIDGADCARCYVAERRALGAIFSSAAARRGCQLGPIAFQHAMTCGGESATRAMASDWQAQGAREERDF